MVVDGVGIIFVPNGMMVWIVAAVVGVATGVEGCGSRVSVEPAVVPGIAEGVIETGFCR